MKLLELEPRWFSVDGLCCGLSFNCPCCINTEKATRLAIAVHHHGLEAQEDIAIHIKLPNQNIWTIESDNFESMTIYPSINASVHGHWHGFIKNGEIS